MTRIFITLVLLISNYLSFAQIENKQNSDNKTQVYIDSLAKNYLSNKVNCGLSIGFIKDNKMTFKYYGETKKGIKTPPNGTTLYEIGSITKTFTGFLLANAVTTNKLSLEDDIRKFLPKGFENLEFEGKPILIKHLSNQTSGLPRLPDNFVLQTNFEQTNPYKNYSSKMMFNFLKEVKLTRVPGSVYEYSNYAVALLGQILEIVTHKKLEDQLSEIITSKFNMPNTKFDLNENEKLNEAFGYDAIGNQTSFWDFDVVKSAGGLKSNLNDMMNYLQVNIEETNPDIILSHQKTTLDTSQNVALNWHMNKMKDDKTIIWHNGGTGGFTSICGFVKEQKIGVIVLNNSTTSVDNLAMLLLKFLRNNQ